jgi:hypothetical protein
MSTMICLRGSAGLMVLHTYSGSGGGMRIIIFRQYSIHGHTPTKEMQRTDIVLAKIIGSWAGRRTNAASSFAEQCQKVCGGAIASTESKRGRKGKRTPGRQADRLLLLIQYSNSFPSHFNKYSILPPAHPSLASHYELNMQLGGWIKATKPVFFSFFRRRNTTH